MAKSAKLTKLQRQVNEKLKNLVIPASAGNPEKNPRRSPFATFRRGPYAMIGLLRFLLSFPKVNREPEQLPLSDLSRIECLARSCAGLITGRIDLCTTAHLKAFFGCGDVGHDQPRLPCSTHCAPCNEDTGSVVGANNRRCPCERNLRIYSLLCSVTRRRSPRYRVDSTLLPRPGPKVR